MLSVFFIFGGYKMETLGQRIKKLRIERNLSQDELAIKLGYKSRSSINKIELGINDIAQSKIVEFAEALGTTPAFLMGWNEDYETNNLTIKMLDNTIIKCALSDNEVSKVLALLATFQTGSKQ